MTTEFKTGDTVRLKSGKQHMSVVEIDQANGEKIATCVWHNSDGKEERGTYPVAALAVVSAPAPKTLPKLDTPRGPGGKDGWMAN